MGAGAALILASSFALRDGGRATHWSVTQDFMDTSRPLLGGRAEMTEALLKRLYPKVRSFDSKQ
jgi:hypothetical protein